MLGPTSTTLQACPGALLCQGPTQIKTLSFFSSHLVGPFESRRVEEGLRLPHVRIRHAARLSAGEGQSVGEALAELVGGLVVHAVHHVQVAEAEVDLGEREREDETTKKAAEM